jgi:3-oxoacyl-[acyl-carrier protein] reductase
LCPPIDTVTLTDADLEATLAVNVRAPHVLTAALAPAMVERGHGAIGSWMAHVGHAFVCLCSATKAAEH